MDVGPTHTSAHHTHAIPHHAHPATHTHHIICHGHVHAAHVVHAHTASATIVHATAHTTHHATAIEVTATEVVHSAHGTTPKVIHRAARAAVATHVASHVSRRTREVAVVLEAHITSTSRIEVAPLVVETIEVAALPTLASKVARG